MKVSVKILALMFLALSAQESFGDQIDLKDLDYGRTIRTEDMVFVPLKGLKRGPIWYTSYEQQVTATSGRGDLRRIVVNLFPKAHADGRYNSFITDYEIEDAKVNHYTDARALCEPSLEITAHLQHMPDGFNPKGLAANYPFVCSLSLYFLPEDETDIRHLIETTKVVHLKGEVSLCSAQSKRFEMEPIVQGLAQTGALTLSEGKYSGEYWGLVYESVLLAKTKPQLFSDLEPKIGWTQFMKKLETSSVGIATVSEQTVAEGVYVCDTETLTVTY